MWSLLQGLYRGSSRQVSLRSGWARRNFVRPCLEVLEGRIVPDAYLWTGAASSDYTDPHNWTDTRNGQIGVPGSSDTGDIPAGSPLCVLNSQTEYTIAGLTVAGSFDLGSKLSVTTGTATSNTKARLGSQNRRLASREPSETM